MVKVQLVITMIIAVIAIILVYISTVIDGIISLSKTGQLKAILLTAAGIGGLINLSFSVIFSIITAIAALMLTSIIGAKLKPRKKTILYTFIIFIAITIIFCTVTIILNLIARENIDTTQDEKRSIDLAILLIIVGFIMMLLATILIYGTISTYSDKSLAPNKATFIREKH